MAFNLLPIEPFDAEGNPNNTGSRWKKWLSNFELFVMASNITDENQKRATLLYSAGKRVQEIHNTISTSNNSYSDTVEKLTAHFTPAVNIPYARHLFREATQRSDEATLQYVTRLRELSSDCDFGVDTDGHIRDQVIEKCCNKTLRLKYLTNIDITLKIILEMAEAHETAHRHASEFENATASGKCELHTKFTRLYLWETWTFC